MSQAAREHVVVINRYGRALAPYESYIDHDTVAVSYISVPAAAAEVPPTAASSVVVETSGALVNDADDRAVIVDAARRLVERHGPLCAVVALHEGDLDVAAEVREALGVPGDRPDDLAPFRDKYEMHRLATEAGLRAPATSPARDADDVLAFGARHGWPVVLKPRGGTGSTGVRRLSGPSEVHRIDPDEDLVVQSFVDAPIVHVDGLFDGRQLVVPRVSRYLGTCMAYETGRSLGSFELEDPRTVKAAGDVVERLLGALTRRPVVFHAELFDLGDDEFSVVEVACRAGGAEIPMLWREVHGIDLLEVAVGLQVGRPLEDLVGDGTTDADAVGGWLLVPPQVSRPCIVEAVDTAGAERSAASASVPAPGTMIHAGGGYANAARFRFAGATSQVVEEQVRAAAERVRLTCVPVPEDVLVLVGSGGEAYREYAMASAARKARVSLVNRSPATWQRAYCDATYHRTSAEGMAEIVSSKVAELAGGPAVGVMTWDESVVGEVAQLADEIGVPGASAEGVANCRDKFRTRTTLEREEGLGVRFRLVHDLAGGRAAADDLGFPLVLKPRSLAGSAGVTRVDSLAQLEQAYNTVASSGFPGLMNEAGVLVEEYLDGTELSVDCTVVDGIATAANVAHKRVGYAPSFEEVGHVVRPWRHEPWAGDVQELMLKVHARLGIVAGVTHAEVRLTSAGPRLVELNCRLGGDFIPLLGELATGVDLVGCAVDIALGRSPEHMPLRDSVAQVVFLYPERDCVVAEVDMTGCAEVDGIHSAIPLARPGQKLVLPPRAAVGRFGALIAVGDSVEETDRALAEATTRAVFRAEPDD